MRELIIDCGTKPVVPEGFTLVSHRYNGTFEWSNGSIIEEFYYDGSIGGIELQRRLSTFPVHNANMLHFLIEHPELKSSFSEYWMKRHWMSFWGTTYMAPAKSLLSIITIQMRCFG